MNRKRAGIAIALVFLFTNLSVQTASGEPSLVGVWQAISVDMSFAEGRIPPERMEEAGREFISTNAPSFDLNSDGTARVFGGTLQCDGRWSIENDIVLVECPENYIRLGFDGRTLTSLPDRTFVFERQ